jgi:hypothetical protein
MFSQQVTATTTIRCKIQTSLLTKIDLYDALSYQSKISFPIDVDSKFASSTQDYSIKFVADDSCFTMVKPLSIMITSS